MLAPLLLWAGCATPHSTAVQGPVRSAAPADPAVEVQSRLLQEARQSLAQGRTETATLLLRRLITSYPQSPLLSDAYWWLARSYEQAGEMKDALTQYRLLAQMAQGRGLGMQAKSRIAELERALAVAPSGAVGHTAVLIPSARLPAQQDLEEWVRQLAQAGVTTLVVEAGTFQGRGEDGTAEPEKHPQRRAGVYFRTRWAFTIRDVVGQLVPVAHRHGLHVFSAMALRRMSWVASELQWADQAYDPATRRLVASSALDLLHPAFQEYLLGLLTDLAADGVDGMLFRADRGLSPTESFSPYGLKGFERDFGVRLDPAVLSASTDLGALTGTQPDSTEFWRWTGWRARETLKVLDRLGQALRKQSPKIRIALEMHPEAVTDPVRALVRFNEDLLEAKRLRFDYYVVGGQFSFDAGKGERLPGIIERTVALIGDAGRIWVALPFPGRDVVRGGTELAPEVDRASFVKGIGIMYVPNTYPAGGAVP